MSFTMSLPRMHAGIVAGSSHTRKPLATLRYPFYRAAALGAPVIVSQSAEFYNVCISDAFGRDRRSPVAHALWPPPKASVSPSHGLYTGTIDPAIRRASPLRGLRPVSQRLLCGRTAM